MKRSFFRKITAVLLCVVLFVFPVSVYAEGIPGENTDEKASEAGYDLYETISILVDSYAGSDLTVEQLYMAALRGMAAELDEYSYPMTAGEFQSFSGDMGKFTGIGIVLGKNELNGTTIVDVLKGSPASRAGVLVDDDLIKVNGTDVTKLTTTEVVEIIFSVEGAVELEIKRGEETLKVSVEKEEIIVDTVEEHKFGEVFPEADPAVSVKIGYAKIFAFGEQTLDEFQKVIEGMKKKNMEYLFLDLRDNSGGILETAEAIAKLIVPAGAIYHIKFADGSSYAVSSELKEPPFKHIVVLTNYYTASASELLAAALQDSNAGTIVGQKTFGKGTVQSLMPILVGGVFKYTTAEYLRRSGAAVNKIGVNPNVGIVKPHYLELYADTETQTAEMITGVLSILKYIGYEYEGKSEYGDAAKDVIKKFQTDNELSANGIVNYETCEALNVALNAKLIEKDLEELRAGYNYLLKNFINKN
ncbi:MAG: PDZ domain-containing protein [Clostridiales bacterium]|nr:PDZ domain-containing protein [Clostridiales bacterium]